MNSDVNSSLLNSDVNCSLLNSDVNCSLLNSDVNCSLLTHNETIELISYSWYCEGIIQVRNFHIIAGLVAMIVGVDGLATSSS